MTDAPPAPSGEEPGRLATVEALRVLEDPTDVKLKTLTQLARVAFGGSSLSGSISCTVLRLDTTWSLFSSRRARSRRKYEAVSRRAVLPEA